MSKKLVLASLSLLMLTNIALAADQSCADRATEKKLAGAAKNSFLKKCEKDTAVQTATTDCTSKAADKKLAGAAKNSFVKKCVADAQK